MAAYLAAEEARDREALIACFTDDALVRDEGRDHRGLDAIKNWRNGVESKFQYEVEPLDAAANGDTVALHVRLSGNFPGSPVELDYTFKIGDDKIRSLVID